jgi:nucleoside-diphosphate-sugar epimerase
LPQILREDLRDIVSDGAIPWEQLRGTTVLVTGASGLIGSAIVRALEAANSAHSLNVKTLALSRSVPDCAGNYAEYIARDLCEAVSIDSAVDYVFHCAAITKSSEMAARPVDVIANALKGTANVLELAREKSVRSFVYLSSMEVYGQFAGEAAESDLGGLDLTNPRSCYPESKRMCEVLCAAYLSQYGVAVKIARPAQTFGAGTPKNDTRVFAQFARSVIAGENIVLRTEGNSRGNYCYTADAVRGLLLILLKGKNGEAYNIANPESSAAIREMAEIAAAAADGKISVVVEKASDPAKLGYAPDSALRLNIGKISELGWKPKRGLAEMYRRMFDDWRSLPDA